ncbi:MAG: peptidoglycan DD-metalloendopeptidase family protein [Candidatus Eremiobacteraeota bacterium]|nr:peptidoglycan DD-metalloendopeptidase family protein [Candidatus Eremiobacteraeota bacterium]
MATLEVEKQQMEIQQRIDELSEKLQNLLKEGKIEEAQEISQELSSVMKEGKVEVPEAEPDTKFISKASSTEAPEVGQAIHIPRFSMPVIAAAAPIAAPGTAQAVGYINGEVRPYNGQLVSPIARGQYHVTSEFGPRPSMGDYHTGIDLGAKTGTPVHSVADGTVTRIAYDARGYGNWVEVKHSDGTYSRYAHLSAFGNIKVGQKIGAGTVVGAVGSTGHSTGPHLHFEWRDKNHKAINPRRVMDF